MSLLHRRLHFRGGWWLAGGVDPAIAVAAYQPKGAIDLASSYINLANPGTYNATVPSAAPTFDAAKGWIFGAAQYLDTGYVPGTGSISVVVAVNGITTTNNSACFGMKEGTKRIINVFPRYISNVAYFTYQGQTEYTIATGNGVFAVTPGKGYFNGAPAVTISNSPPATTTTYSIYVGKTHVASMSSQIWTGNISAFVIYSDTLTAAQVAAISAAMAAL